MCNDIKLYQIHNVISDITVVRLSIYEDKKLMYITTIENGNSIFNVYADYIVNRLYVDKNILNVHIYDK